MNSFGKHLRLTTFGESHGPAMGGVIDGFPAGMRVDFDNVAREVASRRPGSSPLVTARDETDTPEFLSGISPDGVTLGTPIGFIVRNRDARSADYSNSESYYRPNHADYTYMVKYGLRDARGGGRSSARETVSRVVAGALALQWLAERGVNVSAALTRVGDVDAGSVVDEILRAPGSRATLEVPLALRKAMEERVAEARAAGDSVGGRVSCLVTGVPPGIGAPVGDKLQARLAQAMLSINAAKGFEYGIGFNAAGAYGSESADLFLPPELKDGPLRTSTDFSGGIQGGISNGMPVVFSVAFKPTPTIMRPQPTVDTEGRQCVTQPRGRHDPCVALRAVPVVKAMAALTIADLMLGD